jgi:hypothetical protein
VAFLLTQEFVDVALFLISTAAATAVEIRNSATATNSCVSRYATAEASETPWRMWSTRTGSSI